jgi:DNA-binding FadR family transcriptional regulator
MVHECETHPSTACATVLRSLRSLVSGLAPETRLPPERDIAAEHKVGRRAVRRALDVLEAEGLVWRRQGKGTFVGAAPPEETGAAAALADRTNPEEVLEARESLEPALAGLAALRATKGDVARLRALADRIAEAEDADARELWDGALHRMIARLAGNALLLGLFEILEEVRRDPAWRALRERARSADILSLYAAQHTAIVDAIASRDPTGAERAMRAHLAALGRNILPHAAPDFTAPGRTTPDPAEPAHAE